MKKWIQELTGLAAKGQAEVNKAYNSSVAAKGEGRNQEWTEKAVTTYTYAAKEALVKIQAARMTTILDKLEEVNSMIEPNKDHAARTYHLTRAATLAQGRDPENLVGMYKQIMADPEARAFKGEYEAVIGAAIEGSDYGAAFLDVKRQHMTEQEKDRERHRIFLQSIAKHMQTLSGLEAQKVEQLHSIVFDNHPDAEHTGGNDGELMGYYDDMVQNAIQNAEKEYPTKKNE